MSHLASTHSARMRGHSSGEKASNCFLGPAASSSDKTLQAVPLVSPKKPRSQPHAYGGRSGRDRTVHEETVSVCHESALQVWAARPNDLGNAFCEREGGDRAANLEAAIACHMRSSEVRTREAAPLEWAATQNALGNAYRDRVIGDGMSNAQAAVACYERAPQVHMR